MKINQDKEYKPVTITLETKSEYNAFFRMMDNVELKDNQDNTYIKVMNMARELSNFATNNT
jgi:hypothetical protein